VGQRQPTGTERLRQSAFVEIIKFAADGHTVRQLSQADRIAFQPLGKVMRGRLTF
jgi:hypothetical protein